MLVEVDYWIHGRLHVAVLTSFLQDILDGAYLIEELRLPDYRRAQELCDRYSDADIGFVDASVLAVVERLGEPKIATLRSASFRRLASPSRGRLDASAARRRLSLFRRLASHVTRTADGDQQERIAGTNNVFENHLRSNT